MRDGRRPPLCYQETEALRMIRGRDRGKRGDLGLVYALAVYGTMTELAEAGERQDINREGFRANRREIAELSGTSTQTVDRVVAELEGLGLLHVDHRGEGGEESLWTLISPGAPKSAPPELPEPEPPAPKTKPAREKQYHEYADPFLKKDHPEELEDGLELLRQGRKVDGALVTPIEMAKAAICIAAFNRCYEFKGATEAGYGLGPNLSAIVMRVRDRPSWDAAKHVRLVESAWRIRWWERRDSKRRPSPNVIWSPKSFEQVAQDAKDEAAGEKPEQIGKRRYTHG